MPPALSAQPGARIANVIEEHNAMTETKQRMSSGRKLLYIVGAATVGAAAIGGYNYARETCGQRQLSNTVSSEDFYEFASPAGYNIPFKDLTLSGSKGAKLKAWLFPSKSEAPTVVYLHGQKSDAGWMLPQMAALYKKSDCNMVVMNYRDCKFNATGDDIKTAISDVSSALTHLKSADDSPINDDLILLGSGTGAQVAVDVAAKMKDVSGLILENPRQGVPLKQTTAPWLAYVGYFVPKWVKDFCTELIPTAQEQLAKSKVPVMLYADENFSSHVAKNWFMRAGSPDRVLVTPGAWTGPRSELDQEWLNQLTSFINDISEKKRMGVQVRAI